LSELTLAFVDDRDGDWEVYRVQADGSNDAILASGLEVSFDLVWSPTGRQIVFRRVNDLVAVDAETGEEVNLTPRRPLHALHVATEVDGVDEVVLDPSMGGGKGLAIYRYFWAPDNRHIAYTITNETEGFGTADVFVLDICEGTPLLGEVDP
jgi:hypothetical protein